MRAKAETNILWLPAGHSEEAAHDMFAAVDTDKSGTASMDEFLLW